MEVQKQDTVQCTVGTVYQKQYIGSTAYSGAKNIDRKHHSAIFCTNKQKKKIIKTKKWTNNTHNKFRQTQRD